MATQKPDLTRVWANGAPPANVVDPDDTTPGKVNAGWQAEVPPFEHFNFLQKWFTQGLAHFNEQGIGVWDVDTNYPVDGMAKGSDGNIYKCIVEQSGNDPVGDLTNWELYIGPDIGNSKLLIFNDVSSMKSYSTISYKVGMLLSTGSTLWRVNDESLGTILIGGLYAYPLNALSVYDINVRASNEAVDNYSNILTAITDDLYGANSIVFGEDIEVDIASGPVHIDFSPITRPLYIDTGSNWIKYKNQLRGGSSTSGSFVVGTDRTIGDLNLDGMVESVTEAQLLSEIVDPFNPVYSNGIQRGFYHKTQDNLIVNGTLRVKGFRHFGFDVTGDSTPTKSFNIKINNLEIQDCFGYNYIMAALVRYDSIQINSLKCITSADAWLNRPDTGTPVIADIAGFDIEPAKTNGSIMSALNINSVEVQGCVVGGFSDETYNHAQRVNISNFVGRNPDSTDSGFGLSMVGTEANISNVNMSSSGKFEIEEKSTTDNINNTRTVNFSNVHIEKQGYSGNLLVDADFSSLNSWVERGSQTNELTTDGEFGKYRLHMANDAAGSTVGRRQDVPCIAGETYVYGVHAESYGTNNGGNASAVAVSISFYDAGDTLLGIKSIRLVDLGLGVKGKTIGTATAPSNSSYIRFNISAEGSSSANANAYIDAAFLYRGYGFDRFIPSTKKSAALQIDWNVDNIGAGVSDSVVRIYPGARVGQTLVVTPKTSSVGIIFYGYVTADDEVTIVATNMSNTTIDLPVDEYYTLLT